MDLQDGAIDEPGGEELLRVTMITSMSHNMATVVSADLNDFICKIVLARSTTRTLPTFSWVICCA
jgi:hypothetical protein